MGTRSMPPGARQPDAHRLSTLAYKVQCSDGNFAMLCLNADPTHKRCACQRGGRYFWTAGYDCHGRLLCEAQRCR
jgi:hypothetical protein